MATAFSHAIAALSIGTLFRKREMAPRVWIASVVVSVIPDLDVIGFHYGVRYGDFWGHRGFTHSLLFAAVISIAATLMLSWRNLGAIRRFPLMLCLFLSTASHGLLDAMTNGGLGVAFFSPFNNRRCFLPWRPIQVSPIAAGRFFGPRAPTILASEFLWIWIPAGLLAIVALVAHRPRSEMKATVGSV